MPPTSFDPADSVPMRALLAGARRKERSLLDFARKMVQVESPSDAKSAVDACAALAAAHGEKLPADADSAALNAFLRKMRESDNVHYADISLAIIKLMGPGEYVLARAGSPDPGHFALAVHDYTHSTAPNRRFADLVTQRLVESVLIKKTTPYSDSELDSIATNCTLKEDDARHVERAMGKRIAAVALADRIGALFNALVTGVTPKGTFVRITNPPAEGLLIHGEQGVDVGVQLRVRLVSTDPRRGYIDFARQ